MATKPCMRSNICFCHCCFETVYIRATYIICNSWDLKGIVSNLKIQWNDPVISFRNSAQGFSLLTQRTMSPPTFISLIRLDMRSDMSAQLQLVQKTVCGQERSLSLSLSQYNHSSDTSRSAQSSLPLMSTTRYGHIMRNPASPWATGCERERLRSIAGGIGPLPNPMFTWLIVFSLAISWSHKKMHHLLFHYCEIVDIDQKPNSWIKIVNG